MRTFDAPEALDIRFYEVRAKSALNKVPERVADAVPLDDQSVQGMHHACDYCFARPTHTYLDLDAGRDFEREIVVKVNVPEVAAGGADAAVVEARARRARDQHRSVPVGREPVQADAGDLGGDAGLRGRRRSVLTKSPLLLRDIELFKEIAEVAGFTANLSVPTLDEKAWRATEPHTPHPRKRIEAVRS